MNPTRRIFTKALLTAPAAFLPLQVEAKADSEPFCLACQSDRMPVLEADTPGHFSIEFGDHHKRVKTVLLNGKNVTTNCYACKEGQDGFAVVYPRTAGGTAIICPNCREDVLRQVRFGVVKVSLK